MTFEAEERNEIFSRSVPPISTKLSGNNWNLAIEQCHTLRLDCCYVTLSRWKEARKACTPTTTRPIAPLHVQRGALHQSDVVTPANVPVDMSMVIPISTMHGIERSTSAIL